MNIWIRRSMIGVGAALLAGGWGTTRHAHGQRQTVSAKDVYAQEEISNTYTTGVWLMALGAGLIGFAAIRTNNPLRAVRPGIAAEAVSAQAVMRGPVAGPRKESR